MSIKKIEKRDAILYVKITPTNKKYVKKQAKAFGYSSLSEFVNEMINGIKKKVS